jgi:hypothetical protein
MSIQTRSTLKAGFTSGSQATSEKFDNLIDSAYNKSEDSLLFGPLGLTGNYGLLGPSGGTNYGLLGPSGGTYIGFYLYGSTAPTGSTASGSTGQVIISITGGSGSLYLHNGSQWFVLPGLTSF